MLSMLLTLSLLACGDKDSNKINNDDGGVDSGDTGVPVDEECAEIDHDPIENAQLIGVPIDIQATVTDASGVFLVELYYKQETTTTWKHLTMVDQGGGNYVTQIPAADVGSGGMDYYLRAVDAAQNDCTLPTDGEDDAWHFRVTAS
ncbi:MAG: hypothetical protein H6742_11375 [Alphaproteobacteria bacterium]|nr:hypothetical protein [Alphaproteobacteria bacterium]